MSIPTKKYKDKEKSKIVKLRNLLALGDGLLSKIKLLLLLFWLKARKMTKLILRLCGNIGVKNADGSGKAVMHLRSVSDIEVFREVFLNEEYAFEVDDELETIFDLGSNVGLSIVYFYLNHPNAQIYGFEPDSRAFKQLKETVESLKNVQVFNLAVSDRDGEEKFYAHLNTASSSLSQRVPNQESVLVKTKTLDTLMNDLGADTIDLMKFDIEGAEEKIFGNFANLRKVKNLIGEVHLDLMSGTKEDFLKKFDGFSKNITDIGAERFLLMAFK